MLSLLLFDIWFKYEIFANALENSKLGYEYVRIDSLSKYSKYAEGLQMHMSHFYIYHGLLCQMGSKPIKLICNLNKIK